MSARPRAWDDAAPPSATAPVAPPAGASASPSSALEAAERAGTPVPCPALVASPSDARLTRFVVLSLHTQLPLQPSLVSRFDQQEVLAVPVLLAALLLPGPTSMESSRTTLRSTTCETGTPGSSGIVGHGTRTVLTQSAVSVLRYLLTKGSTQAQVCFSLALPVRADAC